MTERSLVNKPWGYEEILEANSQYVLKRLFMEAGHQCSLQLHENKHETAYLISGLLEVTLQDEEKTLYPGMYVVIGPGEVHRMTAIYDSIYIEASTPHLDDVVRLKDNYGRA